MISHLHLECLNGRNVSLLVLESYSTDITRQNLLEAVLLKSRLKSMNINTAILLAEHKSCCEASQDVLQSTKSITTEALVNMGRKFGIDIPENLSPNRFGRLQQISSRTLIGGFAESGTLTAVTMCKVIISVLFSGTTLSTFLFYRICLTLSVRIYPNECI